MKNKELPPDMENVMVTYDVVVERPYESRRVERRCKRGFYSSLFGKFSMPPSWNYFNGVLLPDGFGGDHFPPDKIIRWDFIKDQID